MVEFEIEPLIGWDVYLFRCKSFFDERGAFQRLLCQRQLSACHLNFNVEQINHSFTVQKGTVRGMHFQKAPSTEAKIVQCIGGAVFDCVVDLRQQSTTYGQSYCVKLGPKQEFSGIYIPNGFAHGFQSLSSNVSLVYMHSDFFDPKLEGGVNCLDSCLGFEWPLAITSISKRDAALPNLGELV